MRMLIGSMLALTIALSGSVATAHTVRIVGYLENATILPIGLAMKAKMDTGADVTLMHAIDIERYQEDGENWVRFTLEGEGRNVIVRRPLVRVTRLRFAGNQVVERPVVQLGLCVAGYYKLAEVTLSDRSKMSTPLLIGKRFMRSGGLVVDPASENVGRPICD